MDATWLYNSIMQVIFIITALVSMKSLTEMITQLVGQGDALKDGADTAKEVAKKAGQTAAIAAGGAGLAMKGAQMGIKVAGVVGGSVRGSRMAGYLSNKAGQGVAGLKKAASWAGGTRVGQAAIHAGQAVKGGATAAGGFVAGKARALGHYVASSAPAQAIAGGARFVAGKAVATGSTIKTAAVNAGGYIKNSRVGQAVGRGARAGGRMIRDNAVDIAYNTWHDSHDLFKKLLEEVGNREIDSNGKIQKIDDSGSAWDSFAKAGQEFNKLWGAVSGITGFYKQMESDDAIIGGDEGKMHQFMKDFFKFENDKEKAIKASNAQADRTAAGAARLTAEEFMNRMGSTTVMPDGTKVSGLNNVTLNAGNVDFNDKNRQVTINGDARMQVTNTPEVKLESGSEIKLTDSQAQKLTDAIDKVNTTSKNIIAALNNIENKLP